MNLNGSAGAFLLDGEGKVRTSLEHDEVLGSQLTVRDEDETLRGFFGLDGGGSSTSLLFDTYGRRRIGMLVNGDQAGQPAVAIEDDQGRTRLELGSTTEGAARLRMFRPNGEVGYQAP